MKIQVQIHPQYAIRLIGVTYAVLGIAGFIPFELLNPIHHEGIGSRYLLNLVAINALHNAIHLALGISALWYARTRSGARVWGVVAGAVLLLLFAVGMVQAAAEHLPRDQMLVGVLPLNSPGHILHLVTGGLALLLGLGTSSTSDH